MINLKNFVRKIPGVWFFVRAIYSPVRIAKKHIKNIMQRNKLKDKSPSEVFSEIYSNRSWDKGKESVSGSGSDLDRTETIRIEFPKLIADMGIKTVLDVPCGDFWWMKDTDLGQASYIGADIVNELIDNNKQYENERRSFVRLDLIADSLSQVDLIFVRDCLVHLSFSDICKALRNIVNSNSKYLLTTTFVDRENVDIVTGQWRAINLQKHPFMFPEPIRIINENNPDRTFSDKSLGLWEIKQIAKCLSE